MIRPYIQVTNTLTARTQRLIRYYRGLIMDEMVNYLDRVKLGAIQEIIPSKDPSNRWNFTRMYRNQKSTPGKLTERTGALIKMLRDSPGWVKKSRSRSMSGDAMQGNVAVTTQSVIIAEQFYGSLSANIRNNVKYWPWIQGKTSNKSAARPTKQQLLFRFKWEEGIRGEKRQFIEPSAKKQYISTESIMQAKLDHLETLGVIQYI